MEYLFDRRLPRAQREQKGIQWLVLAALVMTTGWLATARADAGTVPGVGDPRDAAAVPTTQSAQSVAPVNAVAAPKSLDVTVLTPTVPTDQELAGDSLQDFILHHATTHYVASSTAGNLSRWRGGLQSVCPFTDGLSPGFNAFVTARIRAIATYVGAPVHSDPKCKSNVQVFFTNKPQEKMDAVAKWATVYFRNGYSGGMRDLLAFKSGQAIQGWYLTTTDGDRVLNTDVALVGIEALPVWPQITQQYSSFGAVGTRVGGGGSGSGIGIGIVILVVDTTKVVGLPIGAIADYAAMLALSVAQSPDHCDPLPSILDLMSSSCGTRGKPSTITAGDLAFLKALYYKNTGLGPSASMADIHDNMMRQFNRR